jgi:hypothetical protein
MLSIYSTVWLLSLYMLRDGIFFSGTKSKFCLATRTESYFPITFNFFIFPACILFSHNWFSLCVLKTHTHTHTHTHTQKFYPPFLKKSTFQSRGINPSSDSRHRSCLFSQWFLEINTLSKFGSYHSQYHCHFLFHYFSISILSQLGCGLYILGSPKLQCTYQSP